ncbi:MAG: hypothetical protein JF614_27620 [Acidobacteria bacterium]|nr:hypothetical protein [Acidobacteriota bacterium]
MIRPLRALFFAVALLLTGLAVESQAASGWTFEGCWSLFPTCAGARDVYRDSAGNFWECGACGTTRNPSPKTCNQAGNLNSFGYWCS